MRRQPAIFMADRETAFSRLAFFSRHEIVQGTLSPEEWRLLSLPGIAGRNADSALPGATMPMHCSLQKLLKGWSPEKILSLTLSNR